MQQEILTFNPAMMLQGIGDDPGGARNRWLPNSSWC